MAFSRFYVTGVPGLGNVAISRHAQAEAEADGICEEAFHRVLTEGTDTPDGLTTVWRELGGDPSRGSTAPRAVSRGIPRDDCLPD